MLAVTISDSASFLKRDSLRELEMNSFAKVTNKFLAQSKHSIQATALKNLKSTLFLHRSNTRKLLKSKPTDTLNESKNQSSQRTDNQKNNEHTILHPGVRIVSTIASNNTKTATLTRQETQLIDKEIIDERVPTSSNTTVIDNKKRPNSSAYDLDDTPKKVKLLEDLKTEIADWDDLDQEDFNDPLMISEYVQDIFDYLMESERATLPCAESLLRQPNMIENRDVLVNWIISVHEKFDLLPETLYLTMNLLDRFLSKTTTQLEKLQLAGISCLFIASKYEEVYPPSIKNFAAETDGACSVEEIKNSEIYILKVLEFNLSYPNHLNFLRRVSKADDYDIQSRTLAKYLMEITMVDHRFIGVPQSLCATAAMYLSRKMLGKPYWNKNLIHYSGGYTKIPVSSICEMMVDYLVSPIVHENFYRKYQSRRYMKASIVSAQWAIKMRKHGYDVMNLHE